MLQLGLDSNVCRHNALFNVKSDGTGAQIIGDIVHGSMTHKIFIADRRGSYGRDMEVTEDTFNSFAFFSQVTSFDLNL